MRRLHYFVLPSAIDVLRSARWTSPSAGPTDAFRLPQPDRLALASPLSLPHSTVFPSNDQSHIPWVMFLQPHHQALLVLTPKYPVSFRPGPFPLYLVLPGGAYSPSLMSLEHLSGPGYFAIHWYFPPSISHIPWVYKVVAITVPSYRWGCCSSEKSSDVLGPSPGSLSQWVERGLNSAIRTWGWHLQGTCCFLREPS